MKDAATYKRLASCCKEDGDCLIWQGGTNSAGHPKSPARREDGTRTSVSTRRLMWVAVHGSVDSKARITVTCGNSRCLEPTHLKAATVSEVSIQSNARLHVKAKRFATCAKQKRTGQTKLSIEIAREIRSRDTTIDEEAKRYGVHRTLVSAIRRNIVWKDYSNPFAGL